MEFIYFGTPMVVGVISISRYLALSTAFTIKLY